MNKEVMDMTCSVYALGIQEGFRRAVNILREDTVKRGSGEELFATTEYYARLLLGETK